MSSMFELAMGNDFARLHPMLQRRFGVGLDAGYACVGRGTMRRIRRGLWWTVPFLQLGRVRNILVPDTGTDVPFTIHNYPYRDPLGREAVTFVREYELRGRTRHFDATMIRADDGHIVDYLGTHQHLAVDPELRAEDDGSLLLRSSFQRFYECFVGFPFPLVMSGRDLAREVRRRCGSVPDRPRRGEIGVRLPVRLRRRVHLHVPLADDAPGGLKPVRYERRE